jgi:hypothetical protein
MQRCTASGLVSVECDCASLDHEVRVTFRDDADFVSTLWARTEVANPGNRMTVHGEIVCTSRDNSAVTCGVADANDIFHELAPMAIFGSTRLMRFTIASGSAVSADSRKSIPQR